MPYEKLETFRSPPLLTHIHVMLVMQAKKKQMEMRVLSSFQYRWVGLGIRLPRNRISRNKVKPSKCTVQGPEYLENERAESRVS